MNNNGSSFRLSLSTDLVFNPKYHAIVDIRSLNETEEVLERFMVRRKIFDDQRSTIRIYALIAPGTSAWFEISLDPIEVY